MPPRHNPPRGEGREGSSVRPHHQPAPLLCWGGGREGSASFLTLQPLRRELGRGLGTPELCGVPLLRGDAHTHLESYLILRRRNQSRC